MMLQLNCECTETHSIYTSRENSETSLGKVSRIQSQGCIIPWSRDLIENFIVVQLFKKFFTFMRSEYLLPYSQEPATVLCLEPHESSRQPHVLFL
jgi:hypothetical protein